MWSRPSGGRPFIQLSTGTRKPSHSPEKQTVIKTPCKRREAAVTVSLARNHLRVFFNPDTCKSSHHDLQWGPRRPGAGGPPEELFSQQMMRNTLLFLPGQAFAACCSPTYGWLDLTMKALAESRLHRTPYHCIVVFTWEVIENGRRRDSTSASDIMNVCVGETESEWR